MVKTTICNSWKTEKDMVEMTITHIVKMTTAVIILWGIK